MSNAFAHRDDIKQEVMAVLSSALHDFQHNGRWKRFTERFSKSFSLSHTRTPPTIDVGELHPEQGWLSEVLSAAVDVAVVPLRQQDSHGKVDGKKGIGFEESLWRTPPLPYLAVDRVMVDLSRYNQPAERLQASLADSINELLGSSN